MTAEWAQHNPINNGTGRVWVFNNFIKYLGGSFELLFGKNNPMEELSADTLGQIELRTERMIDRLFIIENVTYERFLLLGEGFGFEKDDLQPRFTGKLFLREGNRF
jgi:hypothetical protein